MIGILLLAIAALSAPPAQQPAAPGIPASGVPMFRKTDGSLFDNVVAILREHFHDQAFRQERLPALAARQRRRAEGAASLHDQRTAVQGMLAEIPNTHLGLLSQSTYRMLFADLQGRPYPMFGFQLQATGDTYQAVFVYEGAPAARAGLLAGDRVIAIDGVPVERSTRLDWRSDDAFLGDERDPAIHALTAAEGDRIQLQVERRPGQLITVHIVAEPFAVIDATRASARVVRRGRECAGYLHFWYVHISGVPGLLQEKIDREFAACRALVIDLRGRGGSFMEIAKIVAVLRAYRTPGRAIVALVDRQSRSGKDILAYELKTSQLARLVGEASAGAVIPAAFADVGHDTILMFPVGRLPRYTELLELKPVTPDVAVERSGLHAAGHDAILTAGLDEAFRLIESFQLPDTKESSR